jgi:hypothetical protein
VRGHREFRRGHFLFGRGRCGDDRLVDRAIEAVARGIVPVVGGAESAASAREPVAPGRRGHVGAVAELQAVSDEVMRMVEMLDGLNRYRLAGNAELLAAWESARNVVAEARAAEVPEPPAGDVRPAA